MKLKQILNQQIQLAEKHKLRLENAYAKMSEFMPLTAESYAELNEEQIVYIDQYLYRFANLQDTIGNKLFRLVLESLGEVTTNKSFIDIFNRLEQLGIIENYDLWIELREIRNEIAHEYEDNPEINSAKLNLIFTHKANLVKYLDRITKEINRVISNE